MQLSTRYTIPLIHYTLYIVHYTILIMSGHSKWANIKHRKEAQDSKKNKSFSKISKFITVSIKKSNPGASGAEELYNSPIGSVALAIEQAKSANMPKSNVIKAIEKGLGKDGVGELFEITYEGYGPKGIAFVVESVTDNKNRTVSELRMIFSKAGGSLGESGSASYMFSSVNGQLVPSFEIIVSDEVNAQKLMEFIQLLENHEDVQQVYHNAKFV